MSDRFGNLSSALKLRPSGRGVSGNLVLTPEYLEQIELLLAERIMLRNALEPFSNALGEIVGQDSVRWPDNETIEHSGAAEEITWGDLRKARSIFTEQPVQSA